MRCAHATTSRVASLTEEILAELDQDGKGAKLDQDVNGAVGGSKFHGEVKTMETGASGTNAWHHVFHGLDRGAAACDAGKLATGKEAIINEVEQFGTEKDKACLRYIIHDEAGTCKEKFNMAPATWTATKTVASLSRAV